MNNDVRRADDRRPEADERRLSVRNDHVRVFIRIIQDGLRANPSVDPEIRRTLLRWCDSHRPVFKFVPDPALSVEKDRR